MGNRSLDEFAGGDPDAPSEGGPDGDPGGADPGHPADGSDPGSGDGSRDGGRDAIPPTYEWSPGGAACAACGAVVEGRWRDGDRLVCPDCKGW